MDVLQKVVYDEQQKVPIARIPTKASVKLISSSSSTIQHNNSNNNKNNNSTPTSTEYYESRYVPEAWASDSRGTYGGDLISQGLNAAWQSVLNRSKDVATAASPNDGLNFQPHSLHTYFVKAGSSESVMRWEVIKVSDSRNFANRCVLGYQSHSDVLVVTLQVSFTRDNDVMAKQRQFEQQMAQVVAQGEGEGQEGEKQVKHWPLVFKRNPGPMFYKYRDNLQDLDVRTLYYSNHITRAMPKEFFKHSDNFNLNTTADQELGMFIKVNDDLNGVVVDGSENEKEKEKEKQGSPSAIELVRRKYLALAYASDSFWASTLMKALGLPVGFSNFKTVSLDHTLYFHDSNFEIGKSTNNNKQKKKTETGSKKEKSNDVTGACAIDLDNDNWIYMETQFVSLGNNRLVAIINFYSLENDGTLIATAVQENYGVFPKQVVDNSRELHEKSNGKSTAPAGVTGGAKL